MVVGQANLNEIIALLRDLGAAAFEQSSAERPAAIAAKARRTSCTTALVRQPLLYF
jgi:hypothetical protein